MSSKSKKRLEITKSTLIKKTNNLKSWTKKRNSDPKVQLLSLVMFTGEYYNYEKDG